MTAPAAPRGTDPRVEALVAYLCGHDFENVGEDHARQYAWFEIRELEAAGLIVALPDDTTVERVARAMHAVKFDAEGDDFAETWDEDMEIIRQGYLDLARAVLAALAGGPDGQ